VPEPDGRLIVGFFFARRFLRFTANTEFDFTDDVYLGQLRGGRQLGDVVKVCVVEVDLKAQANRYFYAQGRGAAASRGGISSDPYSGDLK